MTVNKKDYIFDATDNKLNNFNEIVVKQKSNNELFTEMIEEIKEPSKLLEYFGYIFKNIFKLFKNIIFFLYKHSTIFLLIILLVLLFLLFI